MAVTECWDDIHLSYNLGAGDIRRTFLCDGLSHLFTQTTTDNLLIALLQGLPAFAAPHPSVRNAYVGAYSAAPFPESGKDAVKMHVDYFTPSPSHPLGGVYVELTGSNSQYVVNRWPNGDMKGQPILIGYRPIIGARFLNPINPQDPIKQRYTNGALPPSASQYDTAEIPIESPNALLTLSRMETTNVLLHESFRKSLNSNTWMGLDPKTVFIHDIQARKVFGMGPIPDHFVVTYFFEVADSPDYWQKVAFFRRSDNGKPVICDLDDGTNNGYTIVDAYDFKDFNQLKFPTV